MDKAFKGEFIILGNIITEKGKRAEYLWVKDGRIKTTGDGIPLHSPRNIPMTLLAPNWYVLPGLYDSHVHLRQTAIHSITTDLSEARCKNDIIEIMRSSPEVGGIKIGRCFDDTAFPNGDIPTRRDLDCVSDRPVFISRIDSHLCVVNTAFLKYADESMGIELPETRDGIFRTELYNLLYDIAMSGIDEQTVKKAILKTIDETIKRGIVYLHCLEGGKIDPVSEAIQLRETLGKTNIKYRIYPQTFEIDEVVDAGFDTIGGCLLVDGSIGSRTAALTEPYSDKPDDYGDLYLTRETLTPFIMRATGKGLQTAFHTIGDRATEEVISAYQSVGSLASEMRCRMEHFVVATNEHIKHVSELGLCVSMQPTFDRMWGGEGGMYNIRLGGRKTNRIRSAYKSGIVVAGGSDSDITPLDSLLGMASAMNHHNPEERLTFEEALHIYTYNSAYLAFEEKERGSLTKGKYADFIIVNDNPEVCLDVEHHNLKVLATFIDGDPIFLSEELYSCVP